MADTESMARDGARLLVILEAMAKSETPVAFSYDPPSLRWTFKFGDRGDATGMAGGPLEAIEFAFACAMRTAWST